LQLDRVERMPGDLVAQQRRELAAERKIDAERRECRLARTAAAAGREVEQRADVEIEAVDLERTLVAVGQRAAGDAFDRQEVVARRAAGGVARGNDRGGDGAVGATG